MNRPSVNRRSLFHRLLVAGITARMPGQIRLLDMTKLPDEPRIHGLPASVWQALMVPSHAHSVVNNGDGTYTHTFR